MIRFRTIMAKRWVPIVAAFACVMVVLITLGYLPLVRFPSEEINIVVHEDHVDVEGTYVYRNPWPMPVMQGLSIPLPIDAQHPSPWMLKVEQLKPEAREIAVRYFWGRHRFNLRLGARSEVWLRVSYRQFAPAHDARYILTTTHPWLQSLERGRYRVRLDGVTLTDSNYPLQPNSSGGGEFVRTSFMPPHDWCLAWQTKP